MTKAFVDGKEVPAMIAIALVAIVGLGIAMKRR